MERDAYLEFLTPDRFVASCVRDRIELHNWFFVGEQRRLAQIRRLLKTVEKPERRDALRNDAREMLCRLPSLRRRRNALVALADASSAVGWRQAKIWQKGEFDGPPIDHAGKSRGGDHRPAP